MTHLQQTCSDLLHAQEQQQRLLGFERMLHHDKRPTAPQMRVGMRHAMFIQDNEILRCQAMLAVNFTAANDDATLPGAA